jgi:alkylation response protein AidB-like acyl-CoA dehydrogenase
VWREAPAPATPDPLWPQLVELGWLGLEIPEEHGGAGLGFAELCLLLHEQGRVLAGGAFLATTVLGVGALAEASEDQRARWLPRVADGDARMTAAVGGRRGIPGTCDVQARAEDDGWTLHGSAGFVLSAPDVDALAVAARHDHGGLTLFLVEAGTPGLDIVPRPTLDASRTLGDLELDGVRVTAADALGAPGQGAGAIARLADRAAVAIAADAVGGAEFLLELTVAYLKDREQFGRPIGSFQALKHRAADMLVELTCAREAVAHAARVAPDDAQAHAAASIAKAQAGETFALLAGESVSLHGGIGFTWEHDCHLYLKRAGLDRELFGPTAWHHDRLARLALEEHAPPDGR